LKIGFIDPLAIAEDIISVREDVALEWKELMQNVELDHADLRTEIFRRQMAKWGQTIEPKKEEEEEQEEEEQLIVEETKVEMAAESSSSVTRTVIQGGDFE
jgi:hypothetical protein